MIKRLDTSEVAQILSGDSNAGFSYDGAYALAEYLEQLEEDMGKPIEFDRVAIRCDFSEYESLQEWAQDYFANYVERLCIDKDMDDDEIDDEIRNYIHDHGQLIEFDGGIIVSSF
jgi:hypothetical protein